MRFLQQDHSPSHIKPLKTQKGSVIFNFFTFSPSPFTPCHFLTFTPPKTLPPVPFYLPPIPDDQNVGVLGLRTKTILRNQGNSFLEKKAFTLNALPSSRVTQRSVCFYFF